MSLIRCLQWWWWELKHTVNVPSTKCNKFLTHSGKDSIIYFSYFPPFFPVPENKNTQRYRQWLSAGYLLFVTCFKINHMYWKIAADFCFPSIELSSNLYFSPQMVHTSQMEVEAEHNARLFTSNQRGLVS